MYGVRKQPRGLFGAPVGYGGIGDGIGHSMPQMAAPEEEEKKRWLDGGKFQAKDALGMALGAIGDAFSRRPNTANMILGSFQQQREAQQAEQNRQRDWEDFTKQYDYKRNNPMPSTASPHYWETNDGSLGVVGPDGKPQIVYQDPTKKTEWIQAHDPLTGAISIIPKPMGGQADAPETLPANFNFGGPASAPGGFPGR